MIPLSLSELEEFLLAGLVMFTLFDTERSKLPIKLNGPESCQKLLESTNNWEQIGEQILSAFEIDSKKVGSVFKQHLQNIVNAQSVVQNDNAKIPKRRRVEENLVDVWTERKKNYISNISKKSK